MKRPRKTLNDRLLQGVWATRASANNIHALYKHETRCKSRVKEIITQGNPYFMTFTLNNESLDKDMDKLLRSIKKALNELGATQYIINTDYGTKKGRLHFHTVATFPKQLDYITVKNEKYIANSSYLHGHVHLKFISDAQTADSNITKYITKVYNHAHKHTAGVIIYSKRKAIANDTSQTQ